MSKQLTPLEVSKQLKDFIFELELGNVDKLFVRGSFDIIETALENYEEMTNTPPIMCGRTHGYTQSIIEYICKNYKEVKITNLEDEDKVKAFEIIKEKRVDTTSLYVCFEKYDLETFNNSVYCAKGEKPLTQKEYNLLKKVLL